MKCSAGAACLLSLLVTVDSGGAQPSAEAARRHRTPAGIEFGVWGRSTAEPAPVLFVLASTIEETLDTAYFRQCGNELADHGYLCVSIDLPCHGAQTRPGEAGGLRGWSQRAAGGQDFVAECNARLSAVLDHLIATKTADAQRIAACGTSRGGFLALHFAAHDRRVKCAAAFAPVTYLGALREFHDVRGRPLVSRLSLASQAEQLAGRPIWIVIGDQDQRVGTHHAFELAQKITAASHAPEKPSRVELHVLPEPRGHTTPQGSAQLAAVWIHRQLFGEELGGISSGQGSLPSQR